MHFKIQKLENALKCIAKEDYTFILLLLFLFILDQHFFYGSIYIIIAACHTKETHQLHTILGGYFYFILMMTDDKCIFELNLNAHCTECGNVVLLI